MWACDYVAKAGRTQWQHWIIWTLVCISVAIIKIKYKQFWGCPELFCWLGSLIFFVSIFCVRGTQEFFNFLAGKSPVQPLSGGKSSWFWGFVSGRISEYCIAAITADKWASLLYSSNCPAKRCISLFQGCVRQSRYGCWLSGSSKWWSSNVCAVFGSGSATQSMENKRASVSWWWAFGLTAEAA